MLDVIYIRFFLYVFQLAWWQHGPFLKFSTEEHDLQNNYYFSIFFTNKTRDTGNIAFQLKDI